MLNLIVRNRIVWLFNWCVSKKKCVYHTFNIYLKTGFGIKLRTIVDMSLNQTKLWKGSCYGW